MKGLSNSQNQIHYVSNFQDFISYPFQGEINAICWTRKLQEDFSEIVAKVELEDNIATLSLEDLNHTMRTLNAIFENLDD